MPKLTCNYGVHFTEITQKYREAVEFQGNHLGDLIEFIDGKYEGFKPELVDSATGKLMTRNVVLIEREGENTHSVSNLETDLRERDILTFF